MPTRKARSVVGRSLPYVRWPTVVRPLAIALIAYSSLAAPAGTAPSGPKVDARHAQLRMILITEDDLKEALDSTRVRSMHQRYPHHDQVLNAEAHNEVVLSKNFISALDGALELPEKPGATRFLVLFAFQWSAKPTRVQLTRSGDTTDPAPLPWSSTPRGANEWYVHDHAATIDPSRGLRWRLAM